MNLAEIVYEGSQGKLVEPKPRAKFCAQIVMKTSTEAEHWQLVRFPKELREFVKLPYSVKIDGEYSVAPYHHGFVGGVIGFGDSAEEAGDQALEHAAQVEGPGLDYAKDSIKDALDAAKNAEEMGNKMF